MRRLDMMMIDVMVNERFVYYYRSLRNLRNEHDCSMHDAILSDPQDYRLVLSHCIQSLSFVGGLACFLLCMYLHHGGLCVRARPEIPRVYMDAMYNVSSCARHGIVL